MKHDRHSSRGQGFLEVEIKLSVATDRCRQYTYHMSDLVHVSLLVIRVVHTCTYCLIVVAYSDIELEYLLTPAPSDLFAQI